MFTCKEVLEELCRRIIKPQGQGELRKQDGFPCSKNPLCLLHLLEARNNPIQALLLPNLTNANNPQLIPTFQQTVHRHISAPRVIRKTKTGSTLTVQLNIHSASCQALCRVPCFILPAALWEPYGKKCSIPFYRVRNQGSGVTQGYRAGT